VPVAVGPILALPTDRFDPYDAPFANPAVLARAGASVAIIAEDAENERNLPFHAAAAAAFGLPREEALRSITYTPARILGLDRELGSLAPGKIADVVVTTAICSSSAPGSRSCSSTACRSIYRTARPGSTRSTAIDCIA